MRRPNKNVNMRFSSTLSIQGRKGAKRRASAMIEWPTSFLRQKEAKGLEDGFILES